MPHANRIIESRRDRREFRATVALIIYHQAEPDAEPNPFVCRRCHHTIELCTCSPTNGRAQHERTARQ